MKTFRQFMKESKDKASKPDLKQDKDGFQTFQTVFGSHSGRKPVNDSIAPVPGLTPDGFEVGHAVFGSHSGVKPNTGVKEDFEDPATKKAGFKNSWYYGDQRPKFRDKQISRGAAVANEPRLPHDFNKYNNAAHSLDKEAYDEKHVTPLHHKLVAEQPAPDHVGHKHGVAEYTGWSKDLNHAMITQHKRGETGPLEHPHENVRAPLQHLLKSHETKDDMHVYTGTSHSPEHYTTHEGTGKKHMFLPAFTSTSINPRTAAGFAAKDNTVSNPKYPGRHLLNIHVPAGSHGKYVEHHTGITGENEFILPHGSRLHVHPEPTTHNLRSIYGDEYQIHEWHAKLLPHVDNGHHPEWTPEGGSEHHTPSHSAWSHD